jgi:hypothetical protein
VIGTKNSPPDSHTHQTQSIAIARKRAVAAGVAERIPVGRVYDNASTQLCVPNALSQPGGYATGSSRADGTAHARRRFPRRLSVHIGVDRYVVMTRATQRLVILTSS